MLKNYTYSNRSLSGNWWIQYTNPIKRSFRICVGGVTLVTATENDPLYVQVENLPDNFDGTPKICIRKIKNTPTQFLCSVEGVNQCVKNAPLNDKIIQITKVDKKGVMTGHAICDQIIMARSRE